MAVAAIALALIAAAAGWWFLNNRQAIPEWDRLPALDFAAPAGDAFASDTPWVNLRLMTARPGEENMLRVQITPRTPEATPVPASAPPAQITSLTAQPLSGEPDAAETLALQPDPENEGAFIASSPLDQAGWWRLSVEVEGAEDAGRVLSPHSRPEPQRSQRRPQSESSPEGEALFRRGIEVLTGLRDVRFTQWIADGQGNASISEHAVTTGDGNSPPGFAYRAVGGMEAIFIGSTRWIKLPGDPGWEQARGRHHRPALGLGRGVHRRDRVHDPGRGDDRRGALPAARLRRTGADGPATDRCLVSVVGRRRAGHVRKEAMASRLHYMLHEFGDFDVPIVLSPPGEAATPVAAWNARHVSAPASTAAAAPARGIPEASPLLMKAAPAIFLLFWSGGFAAGKIGLAYTGPMTFLALRYALVLLVLLPLVLIMRPPLPRTPAAWGHLLVVGFLIQGLYFALGYLALAMDISSGSRGIDPLVAADPGRPGRPAHVGGARRPLGMGWTRTRVGRSGPRHPREVHGRSDAGARRAGRGRRAGRDDRRHAL